MRVWKNISINIDLQQINICLWYLCWLFWMRPTGHLINIFNDTLRKLCSDFHAMEHWKTKQISQSSSSAAPNVSTGRPLQCPINLLISSHSKLLWAAFLLQFVLIKLWMMLQSVWGLRLKSYKIMNNKNIETSVAIYLSQADRQPFSIWPL